MTETAEMMTANGKTIKLLDPEEYRKRHPKKEYYYERPIGFQAANPQNWRGRFHHDDDITSYD